MLERIYQEVIRDHFAKNRQMLFLSGPRQSGKTTSSLSESSIDYYLNWDNEVHRAVV